MVVYRFSSLALLAVWVWVSRLGVGRLVDKVIHTMAVYISVQYDERGRLAYRNLVPAEQDGRYSTRDGFGSFRSRL